ncbi:HIRA-interacting protein 5 [Dichomitus squalens]|uniref:HIRA-interacting protein 5 n=1 Tax=Dichomitus squalens TaxID=114155 RepID=A0A4Q9MBR3_9APHY|nr:HIRA-interacting protein 5 [Dichomitus squalens]
MSSPSFASSSLRALTRAAREPVSTRSRNAAARSLSSSTSRQLSSSSRRSAVLHHGSTFATASPTRTQQLKSHVQRIGQARSMFIQTETTPNDDSLKFIPGVEVMGEGTAEFTDIRSALKSPLAIRLMGIEGVTAVFYGPDFVTVSKDPDTSWSVIKPEVYAMLMEHFSSGQALFRSDEDREAAGPQDTRILDTDSETVAMIKELLETRVRPAIMEDGGDIEYRGFTDDGVVQVKLKGSCRGCSSSTVTLKSGIERMLMHYIPEVKGVEQILDQEEAIALNEFEKLEQRLAKEHGHEKQDSSMAQYMSV